MDVRDVTESQYVNLFPNLSPGNEQNNTGRFGMEETNVADLFSKKPPEPVEEKTTEAKPPVEENKTTETKPEENSQEQKKEENEANILGETEEEKKQAGRKPKYDFSDASGYFENRFKTGKFIAVDEELEDGTKRPFIPKTPEEFDEVIDIQVNYQLEQKQKELEQRWYGTKSPAWQAVAKYAEMTDDPTEILPFLQGVKTIDSVKGLDENEIDGAEKIVRTRLQQRGDSDDLIDEQVEALKTTDRLISTAQKYKPLILQQEQQTLAQMVQQRKQEEAEYHQLITSIRENAIKTIETPLFGKQKLKNDEKAAIYDLIAEPDEQTKGYPIYSAIDNLYEKGDFETLRQVALLMAKKDNFIGYITNNAADKTAENLQKKLRLSTESSRATSNDEPGAEEQRRSVQRTRYSPKFGR